jgi:WD40 repeat protein
MQISADGHRIFSGHSDGAIRIWNLIDNSVTAFHIHQSAVSSICLSHDGRIGVSADSDSNLALWFMDSGELIGFPTAVVEPKIDGLRTETQLAFAPSDRQLLAASVRPEKSLVIREWTLKVSGDPKK